MSQPNEGQDRLDYQETADITEVHAAIAREHAEPSVDVTPIPTWLSIVCAASLCWAGIYIGIFHGGFNPKVYNEYESNPTAFFPLPQGSVASGGAVAELTALALGEKVYKEVCQACHQPTGLGMAGQFPPLAGSEWVDGAEYNEKRVVGIVLKGLKAPITVKGATYNNAMPGQEAALNPKKIAAVLTYVRQAWGNKGGEITEAQVVAGKKEFADHGDQWTAEELKKIPLDAKLEGAGAPAATQVKADAKPGDAAKPADSKPSVAAPGGGSFDVSSSIAAGKGIYMATCFACHQATGMGVPGAFPPLAGTPYVHEDDRRLVAIVLKGIVGAITVDGKIYATGMPSPMVTFPQLKDDKNVADVLNYVRNNFGNKNERAITPDFVGKVRAEFAGRDAQWTEAELLKFPAAK
ncbi:MAG: c-type cytochrome [Chthoniobacteraceae bacterium]